ncbi:hypothetical protein H5410_000986 [Solanum commersonii]|uniref:Uncharacterized protein n=1 Tax=Solanum commersonii TaxID=4109 RepID=A0A9J6AXD2_SOLCO|nr:hypothetical protein H5410_000986 [Solanum commersonii]
MKMMSDKDEVDWFYISMAIGFALSFWGVCGSLFFKRSWRHAYFRFLDRSWEMLLAKLPICLRDMVKDIAIIKNVQTMLFLS